MLLDFIDDLVFGYSHNHDLVNVYNTQKIIII